MAKGKTIEAQRLYDYIHGFKNKNNNKENKENMGKGK